MKYEGEDRTACTRTFRHAKPEEGELYSHIEISDAQARHQRRVRFLRSCDNQHRQLAARLDSCARRQRCKSEADPVCATLYWQKVCRAVSPLLTGHSWTKTVIAINGPSKPHSRLNEIDLAAVVERLRNRLRSSKLRDRIIIGAVDISLYLKNKAVIGWQLHLNLLIEGNNHPRLQKAIEAVFPLEATEPKPYVLTAVTDPEQTLARLYTTRFFRKSWCSAKKREGTARLPLTSDDLQQLLAFLGRYQIGARLLLNGLRWDGRVLVQTTDVSNTRA